MACLGCFKKFFDDKRYTVGLLLAWMIAVCIIFYCLGAFHMSYMHIGPGEDTVFMGLKINTWGKWLALAIFSFFNTCINEFISNALDPWFVNSLQDHKTRKIEYSHATCLWIVQIHCMYVHVMGVFSLFLFFSQVDFAIVRLLADWIVTGYSTVWFIQDKEVVPVSSRRNKRYSTDLDGRVVHDEDAESIAGGEDNGRCHSHHHHHHGSSNSSIDAAQIDVAEKILGGGTPHHVTLYPGMFQMMVRSSKEAREKRKQQLCVSNGAPMSSFTINEVDGSCDNDDDDEPAGCDEKDAETTSQALIRKA